MKSLKLWFFKEASDKGFATIVLCLVIYGLCTALSGLGSMWAKEQELNRNQNKEWITVLTTVVQKNNTALEMQQAQGERIEKVLTRLEEK